MEPAFSSCRTVRAAPAGAEGPAATGAGSATAAHLLPDRLDSRAAGPLAEALLARRGTPLHIDASAVAFVGGLCAQVLLAARSCWLRDRQPFSVIAPSLGFREGLRSLGLEEALLDTEAQQ